MATTIIPIGKGAKQLLKEGIQSTRLDITPGTPIWDGDRKYRWAYIKVSAILPGQVVCKPSVTSGLQVSTVNFASLVAGYGLAAGDRDIRLYGLSALTDLEKYLDGTFMVKSTGGGAGYSYRVNSYEAGRAGNHLLHLEDPLVKALSRSGTVAQLIPNQYYACTLQSNIRVTSRMINRQVAGFATLSGGSGWQLIQTAGLGTGRTNNAQSAGVLLGVGSKAGLSGPAFQLSGAGVLQTSALLHPVAMAAMLTIAGAKYCCVDILIEKP